MDHLAAVGDPELREALLFARSHARPVTADELAQEKGLHRNVARSRLERLVEAGLLAVGVRAAHGPLRARRRPAREDVLGRPAARVDRVPRGSERVARRAARRRARRPRRRRAATRSRRRVRARARAGPRDCVPPRASRRGFERVCAAVRRLGYQASLEHADEHGSGDRYAHVPAAPTRARPPGGGRDRPRDVGRARKLRAGRRRGRRGSLRDARLLRRPRVVQGRARADQDVKFLNTFLWYKET